MLIKLSPVRARLLCHPSDAPLFLLIIFSPLVYKGIKLSLVTAIIVSLIVALVVDILTRREFKLCCKDSQAIFEGMGKVFTSTVSLIVCAELFALGGTKSAVLPQ